MKSQSSTHELNIKLDAYRRSIRAYKKQMPSAKHLLPMGAALLSALPVAEGAIVYSGVKNKNLTWVTAGNVSYNVDINGAGGADMKFRGQEFAGDARFFFSNSAAGQLNGAIGTKPGASAYPKALAANYSVKAGLAFQVANNQDLLTSAYNLGNWRLALLANGSTRFIGIRLNISGSTYYGWVRLTKTNKRNWTIVDWAYNNVANQGLKTGITTLPVELISFQASTKSNNVVLNWLTASEKDNAGFEIQRSTDGEKFQKLTFIEGKGTTYAKQEYVFDDKDLRNAQLYYYRLKQIDYNGEFKYSAVVTAQLEGGKKAIGTFSPNPANNGRTRLDYAAQQAGELNLRVFDATGREVLSQKHRVSEGLNSLDIQLNTLAKGMYFVKMEQGTDKSYQQLVIE